MTFLKKILSRSADKAESTGLKPQTSKTLEEVSRLTERALFLKMKSSRHGLKRSEIIKKTIKYGRNDVAQKKKSPWFFRLLKEFKDPLTILLLLLAFISFITRDYRATFIILIMVLISIFLRFFQEIKADVAAEKLRAMVRTTATVIRNGKEREIAIKMLVPGDIIKLSAGDIIPADIRIIEDKDLFINQATLTGESIPVEKNSFPAGLNNSNPLSAKNLCFMGTNVESGSCKAIVILTGKRTYLGSLAETIMGEEEASSFDLGIKKFTWLIMKFIFFMVPLVFFINGFSRGDWLEAFLFAMAVAVGLAPEMMPMIVAVNLSKGALDMSRKKVIVKHLSAIQNFGAMDILCTDKTGTLTKGQIILEKHLNIAGGESLEVLHYGYLNSFYQTGLKNVIDVAILKHEHLQEKLKIEKQYKKIDEMPFDFKRRRMSVVLERTKDGHLLICKGAVEEVLSVCTKAQIGKKIEPWKKLNQKCQATIKELENQGFRVIALAYSNLPRKDKAYSVKDENGLTLLGFLAFLDPPKDSASEAIAGLMKYGVGIKILTGDNDAVTEKICQVVGLPAGKAILGDEIEKLSDEELSKTVETNNIFAKLSPLNKERIIKALRRNGHAVGFLGDGINDAPALRAADVGISVDTASDIAKESSDIILLEKNLMVLTEGIIEGRKVFGNVIKYIKMAASSNFGNMFSIVAASMFLPYLPMLPIQILVNNLLYDVSQTAIPTDKVDPEYLLKPRKWEIKNIKNFILLIGPISSIFDILTYVAMLFLFNAWNNPALFHTGWFIESLLTQTLIIHIIRTDRIPFIQSRASWPLIAATIGIAAIGIYLPFSLLAEPLGFVKLPNTYWPFLAVVIGTYFVLTQVMKSIVNKKYQE